VSDFNEYRIFEKFNTPLDLLQDILVFGNARKGEKSIEFKNLLIQSKELDSRYSRDSASAIFKIILECGSRINGLKLKTCTLNEKAKKTVEKKSKHEAIKKLKLLQPSESTILSILKQSFGNVENDKFGFKRFSMLTLNLLFNAKKVEVLKCFQNIEILDDELLIKIKDKCDFDIFGYKYQKIMVKELHNYGF